MVPPRTVVVALLTLITVACALLLAPTDAGAQRADTTIALPGGPGIVVGMVIDTAGNPIEAAEVSIDDRERSTRTAANGIFRLTDVSEGRHDLSVRRIGFATKSQRIVVGDSGGRAIVVLAPAVPALQRIVTTAERQGLSGVVSDTAFGPLAGVEVRVFGVGRRAVTDSAGRFFVDLHRGSYMVQLSGEGLEPRLLSIDIPPDSGRWMAVMLREGEAPGRRTRLAIEEMRYRLAWRARSINFFSREELAQWDSLPLHRVVGSAALRSFPSSCLAFIDGGPERLPLWVLDANEVEALEVYAPDPRSQRFRGAERATRLLDASDPRGECPNVYVWMRR